MCIRDRRKAIVDGLAESIAELKEANVGMSEEQIMSILLTNQYLDTLNTFAAKGNQTLFLPNNPNGVDDICLLYTSIVVRCSKKQVKWLFQQNSTSNQETTSKSRMR